MRSHDLSDQYQELFTLSADISTRDRDAIHKTFSGLMKILFPQGGATPTDIEEILRYAIEGRKRIKDQLLRIDTTYPKVRFAYSNQSGKETVVTTLEEDEYTGAYHRAVASEPTDTRPSAPEAAAVTAERPDPARIETVPTETHIAWAENKRGLTFDRLFGPYLKGAQQITITDPYIRLFHQVRNLMELMETVAKVKSDEDEVAVHLITAEDDFRNEQQKEQLQKVTDACASAGIRFTWEFDQSGSIHARHIVTDHGWKILLDRGLDVFQRYEMNDAFDLSNRLQQYRQCKAFEVTFLKHSG